ncbi:MAG: glycosyltransferase family 2 protein [Sulfuriferula sp.]
MNNVQVSIVMPCYNCAAHVESSIASVLAQDFNDWELIVVDDGSTDHSATLIAAIHDSRIQVLHQTNAGVSATRNRALAEATGELVAFLDADDTWKPNFLTRMVTALDSHPDAILAYCGWQNLGLPGGRGEPFIPPDYETPAKLEMLLINCRWPIHAALTRRVAIIDAGGFDNRYANAEDYALWLKVATLAPIIRVAEVLAIYHFHGAAQASANHTQAALQLWQAQREYLSSHPHEGRQLGTDKIRRITHGELLQRGYARYWARDLAAARNIFKTVMWHGHGTLRDWKYMLPALLPYTWHLALIQLLDRKQKEKPLSTKD